MCRPPSRSTVLALALSACGGPSSTPSDAGAPPASDAGGPPPETLTLEVTPHTLAVGDERTICFVLDAGNDVPRQVRAIRASLPVGSHHMIVYRTTEDVATAPFPCSSFETGTAILGVQTATAELVYPDEAALELSAHQHIRLEIHEINYTPAPIDVSAAVSFELYPLDGASRAPVRYLFTGNPVLYLPAHMETAVASFHDAPPGAHFIGMASHTHALGVRATIHRATSDTEYTELLHTSTDWAHPPFDTFEPALVLAPGEGLRLECVFDNTTDRTVTFGLDFADEMCFLGAYYY